MAQTEFYCNASTGSNVNAGDLTANGVVQSTNGAWSTVTNIFTAASGTPFSGVSVGDFCALMADGGTVAVYIARVTTVGGSGATLTLSSTAKSGSRPTTSASAITATTGGAWLGPNGPVNFPFSFVAGTMTNASGDVPRVNMKNNATYNVTVNITHNAAGPVTFQGYTSSVGDLGRATIDGGAGTSYVLFTASSSCQYIDLIFQNNGASGGNVCINGSTADVEFIRCVVNNAGAGGFSLTGSSACLVECEVYNGNLSNAATTAGFNMGGSGAFLLRCISHDNAGSNSNGFRFTNRATCVNCIADTNGAPGFNASGTTAFLYGCIGYNNTGGGVIANSHLYAENCIFTSNSTYGVDNQGTGLVAITNCAFKSNTSGPTHGTVLATGSITLTGDPFNAAATGDFRLNNTASAGASCRQAGRGAFTETQASYTGTVAYPDVGAVETQVVYPTAAQVQLGVTFDVLAVVTGTYNPGGIVAASRIIQNIGTY